MALEITLDVFSGRKNPTWILPTHEFRGITERIEKSNPGQSRQRSKLGYRGMKISTTPDASVSEREFLLELGGSPESLHLSGVPEIEEYLLSMAGDNVDEVIKKHVNSELDAPKPKLGTALFFPACYSVRHQFMMKMFGMSPRYSLLITAITTQITAKRIALHNQDALQIIP